MVDQSTPGKAPVIHAIMCGYVILRCLWRIFIPATEYALPPWPLLSLIFDILVLVALFVLKPQVPAATPDAPVYTRYATPLFVCAIIATAIMVLIRFLSESGWWTGHLMYSF